MKKPAKDTTAASPNADNDTMRALQHDINTLLSNILLALEQLRYEIPEVSEDCQFYLDSISMSAYKIVSILEGEEK
jgi:hypothetical protein